MNGPHYLSSANSVTNSIGSPGASVRSIPKTKQNQINDSGENPISIYVSHSKIGNKQKSANVGNRAQT